MVEGGHSLNMDIITGQERVNNERIYVELRDMRTIADMLAVSARSCSMCRRALPIASSPMAAASFHSTTAMHRELAGMHLVTIHVAQAAELCESDVVVRWCIKVYIYCSLIVAHTSSQDGSFSTRRIIESRLSARSKGRPRPRVAIAP